MPIVFATESLEPNSLLASGRRLENHAEGFCFFSSCVVADSTEVVTGSSAVDSPVAGVAASPPPKVIVVSALDPDAIADVRFNVKVLL